MTIGAMGCQKEIATKIVESKADYMLAVKDNQPTLSSTIARMFDETLRDLLFAASQHQTENKGSGRIEVRRCWTINIGAECSARPSTKWTTLNGIT